MFIISDCNEYAVAVSAIESFRIYDADDDSDFDLYANTGHGYTLNEKYFHTGYPIFSSEDKQKCVAIRGKLVERIKERSRSSVIRVADLVAELEKETESRKTETP